MGQTIFNELKDEFDIELHEALKNYCDAIWCTNRETVVGDFEKTIKRFLDKLTSKANHLYFGDNEFYWCFVDEYSLEVIHESLFNILKVTNWDNIRTENNVNYIIDNTKIKSFQFKINDRLEIFILEYPEMFIKACEYFLSTIQY